MSTENVQRARELRQTQTHFETILWRTLRDRRLHGYKFRRQHPIDRFFADFACIKSKLIVELDGNSHDDRQDRDSARDEYLNSQGWQTLRIRNADLMRDQNSVVLTVLQYLKELEANRINLQ